MRTRNSLLELYKGDPHSKEFADRIANSSGIKEVARNVVRHNEIRAETEGRHTSQSEKNLSGALLNIGVKVMFEPVCFFVPEINSLHRPDFFTNMYIDNRIVAIEVHGIEWLQRRRGYTAEQANRYVGKISRVKARNPDIYFIFVSDMKRGKFESRFGLSTSDFCSKYVHMPNAFAHPERVVRKFERIRNRDNAYIERDYKVWRSHVMQIIQRELTGFAALKRN